VVSECSADDCLRYYTLYAAKAEFHYYEDDTEVLDHGLVRIVRLSYAQMTYLIANFGFKA
jgi:hypothetical protein